MSRIYFGLRPAAGSLSLTLRRTRGSTSFSNYRHRTHLPLGYYEVPPYKCAPDGYYGPEWFSGGVFISAGRWFPWPPEHFCGHVDHHYDFREGGHGGFPARGAHPAERHREFHGSARHPHMTTEARVSTDNQSGPQSDHNRRHAI